MTHTIQLNDEWGKLTHKFLLQYPSINNPDNRMTDPDDWMGPAEMPLSGFSWRSGSTRDTSGILIWNDVFLHTVPSTGEKIAIVVIDTQGLFDNDTTPHDNSRIFALGTLISSIQVLNLTGVVQEDQLQYLQFATEFAKFATNGSKTFQCLMFLIRDWNNDDEHAFGTSGGQEYLNKFLEVKPGQNEVLSSVRQFIRSSFEKLECALLPHPGTTGE
jgi:atlastin